MKTSTDPHHESQVKKLFNHLMTGCKIDRVQAFKDYGIADVRSRISDCEREYGLSIDRERVPNKRYLRYFIKEMVSTTEYKK